MRRKLEALGAPIPRYAEVTGCRRPRRVRRGPAARWWSRPRAAATTAAGCCWPAILARPAISRAGNLAEGDPGAGRGTGGDAAGAGRAGGPVAVRPGRGVAGGGDRAARRHLRRGDRARARTCRRDRQCRQEQLALRLAAELGVVGVLAVELFETVDGGLLVNELAMRPHNSGHWTMDGARTSQFEQHLRAVLDYPLGDTSPIAPVTVMANMLGAPEKPAMAHRRAAAPPVRPDPRRQGAPVRQGRTAGPQDRPRQHRRRRRATKLRERAARAAHWLSHAEWTDGWDGHD